MLSIYATYFLVASSIAQVAVSQKAPVNQKTSTNVISKYNGPVPVDKLKNYDQVKIEQSTIKIDQSLDVSFPKLKILTIENSNLGKVPFGVLQAFPNLEKLKLINVIIDDFKLEYLNSLTKLESLTLEHQKLDKMDAKALNKLKNLRELRLAFMELECIDGDALVGLDNLEVFDVSSNKLKTIEKKTLEPVKKLKKLVLGRNEIEKFGPENLPALPELVLIDIGINPMSFDDIDIDGIKKLAPRSNITLAKVG